jgi:hypothetical protein
LRKVVILIHTTGSTWYSLVPTHYVCNGYLFPGDYYFLYAKKANDNGLFWTHYIHSVLVQDCIRSSLLCESVSLLFAIARSCDAVSSSNRQELKPRQNIYTAKTLSGSKLWFWRNVDILFRTPLLPKSYVSYSHYLVSTVYPFVFCKLFAYQPSQKPLNLLKQHFGGMIYQDKTYIQRKPYLNQTLNKTESCKNY